MKKAKKSDEQNGKGEKPEKNNNNMDLTSIKSDLESTNSTLVKMQEFLSEHGVSSNLSVTDSVQPMVSSSYPLDYKEMEDELKKTAAVEQPKVSTIKKALESRRSDFEEIRQHLERRSQEIKSRIKKIGQVDVKEDDKSGHLSYHSTEFAPDIDYIVAPFKPHDSLTNQERLKLLTEKQQFQEEAKKHEKKKKKADDCQFSTHAIFAHLAKLKSIHSYKNRASETDLNRHHSGESHKSVFSQTSLKSKTDFITKD